MNALAGKTVLITRAQHQAKQMSVAVKRAEFHWKFRFCVWKVCLIGKFNILKSDYIHTTGLFYEQKWCSFF